MADVDSNFQIKKAKIIPSLIKVSRRLNYVQADEEIRCEVPEIMDLYQVTSQHETERVLAGASRTPKKFTEIKVVDGEVKLKIVDEVDYGRNLIAELMIITNRFMAEYAASNFLPAFFRCQDASDSKTLNTTSVGFSPSYNSLTARPHASLGLAAYTQSSSPIRRYQDLCNQRQIGTHLLDKSICYERHELSKIGKTTAFSIRQASIVSKEAKRFWSLQYVKDNLIGGTYPATVVRNDKKKILVELNNCLVKGLVATSATPEIGSEIEVKVVSANPAFNELRLEAQKS